MKVSLTEKEYSMIRKLVGYTLETLPDYDVDIPALKKLMIKMNSLKRKCFKSMSYGIPGDSICENCGSRNDEHSGEHTG